jgi:tripeptidyl-peptidase I
MLGTTYGVYHHPESSDYVLRTLGYSLPSELLTHVSLVSPTTYFGTVKAMRSTSRIAVELASLELDVGVDILIGGTSVPARCITKITPDCLKALYRTGNYTPSATNGNQLGVAGYLDEFANYEDLAVSVVVLTFLAVHSEKYDLQTFLNRYVPNAKGTIFTTVQVNGGGNDQSKPGLEVCQ